MNSAGGTGTLKKNPIEVPFYGPQSYGNPWVIVRFTGKNDPRWKMQEANWLVTQELFTAALPVGQLCKCLQLSKQKNPGNILENPGLLRGVTRDQLHRRLNASSAPGVRWILTPSRSEGGFKYSEEVYDCFLDKWNNTGRQIRWHPPSWRPGHGNGAWPYWRVTPPSSGQTGPIPGG